MEQLGSLALQVCVKGTHGPAASVRTISPCSWERPACRSKVIHPVDTLQVQKACDSQRGVLTFGCGEDQAALDSILWCLGSHCAGQHTSRPAEWRPSYLSNANTYQKASLQSKMLTAIWLDCPQNLSSLLILQPPSQWTLSKFPPFMFDSRINSQVYRDPYHI